MIEADDKEMKKLRATFYNDFGIKRRWKQPEDQEEESPTFMCVTETY